MIKTLPVISLNDAYDRGSIFTHFITKADSVLTSSLTFMAINFFSIRMRPSPNRNMIAPCPVSPNITANRNGKEIIAYRAERIKFNGINSD